MLRAWGFAIFAAVATGQASGSADARSRATAGWKKVSIPEYHLSLEIPALWHMRQQSGYALVAFDPAGDPIVGTALSVSVFGAAGYTFGEFASYVRSNCKQNAHRLDPRAATRASDERFAAGRAQACFARLLISSQGVKLNAVNHTYGFLNGGRGFLVGFQTLARLDPAKAPIFEHVVRSIRFG